MRKKSVRRTAPRSRTTKTAEQKPLALGKETIRTLAVDELPLAGTGVAPAPDCPWMSHTKPPTENTIS